VGWLWALAGAVLAGSASAQAPCAPWPGEPRPLPGLRDADAFRARWAALRVRELSAAARELEAEDPARAQAFWQHASCIAPGDPELARRAAQPRPAVVVHRPALARGGPAPATGDAWDSLSAPIRVAAAGAPRAEPPPRRPAARTAASTTAEADALVEETAAHVRAARFDAALSSAERARRSIAALPRDARAARSARLEVDAAAAALALGREDDARASLARALDASPSLRLDAAVSPKVRRALETVRAERAQ
jgi:hypothetical protein